MFFDPPGPRDHSRKMRLIRGYLHVDSQLLGRPGCRVMTIFVIRKIFKKDVFLTFFWHFLTFIFRCFFLINEVFKPFQACWGAPPPRPPGDSHQKFDVFMKKSTFCDFLYFWMIFDLWTLITTLFWLPMALGHVPPIRSWCVDSDGGGIISLRGQGPELWAVMFFMFRLLGSIFVEHLLR